MLVYIQYKVNIDRATVVLAKAGTLKALLFTPAGAFAVYLPDGDVSPSISERIHPGQYR